MLALLLAAATAWPAPGAPLRGLPVEFPEHFGVHRIFLDAGHGAAGNTGNRSCTCEDEQDFTLRTAQALAGRLRATGHFAVELSRQNGAQVSYRQRLQAAERSRAEVFLSLHSDARGSAEPWEPAPGKQCLRNDAEPGFAVLLSDEGSAQTVAARRSVAQALSRELAEAGFTPYLGADYASLYAADQVPAVFIDRRPSRQRVYLLRRPRMPAVIIETHHALDVEEAARWNEPRTWDAFATAVTRALIESLGDAKGSTKPNAKTGRGAPSPGSASAVQTSAVQTSAK